MRTHARRRIALVLPAAAALWLAAAGPALGQAYGGGPSLDCVEGVVIGDHFRPGSSPGVFVDGELVGRAQVGDDGTFAFPLPSSIGAGSHTVTVQGADAGIRCAAEVSGSVVRPPGASRGAGTAFTGAEVLLLALIAAGLLTAGVALVSAGRRRGPATEDGDGRP